MLVAMAAVLSTGCVNSSPKEIATSISTPVITVSPTLLPTPKPTEIVTAAPTETPTVKLLSSQTEFFTEKESNYAKYLKTTSSHIYAGQMNKEFVIITGQVFNVLPKTSNKDNNGSYFDTIDFQIWGNALSHDEPIYVETMPEKINGTIREGILVEIKGWVSPNWMSGTNPYGGGINQPVIYASSVTVIPERAPD